MPPPASATAPFNPASSPRPPEPGTVSQPWAVATRLFPLTQPSRVGVVFAAAAVGAAAVPIRRSDTNVAARYALATLTSQLNQMRWRSFSFCRLGSGTGFVTDKAKDRHR